MRLVTAGLALALFGAPSEVSAQDGDATDPPGYREAVNEALTEFEAQNYQEARSLFLRAHQLYPNARTHRALGLAEFELRNYVESIPHLEASLGSNEKPLSEAMRREAELTLRRAFGFVGRVSIQLRPEAARLMIDNVRVEAGPRLLLSMGEHTLKVEADGFQTEQQTIAVKGGEASTLRFALKPASVAASPDSAPGQPRASGRAWYKSPWLWTGVGIVLAGAAAGVAVALTRDNAPDGATSTTGIDLRGP